MKWQKDLHTGVGSKWGVWHVSVDRGTRNTGGLDCGGHTGWECGMGVWR